MLKMNGYQITHLMPRESDPRDYVILGVEHKGDGTVEQYVVSYVRLTDEGDLPGHWMQGHYTGDLAAARKTFFELVQEGTRKKRVAVVFKGHDDDEYVTTFDDAHVEWQHDRVIVSGIDKSRITSSSRRTVEYPRERVVRITIPD